jgi:hypothetical protein
MCSSNGIVDQATVVYSLFFALFPISIVEKICNIKFPVAILSAQYSSVFVYNLF